MHKKQNHIYVGLDLHKDTHTAVIIDCWEEKLGSITIENKPSDFTRLMNKVNKIAGDLTPVYGLEDVHGYGRSLAVFLIEKGMVVKEVNSALSYMVLNIKLFDASIITLFDAKNDSILQNIQ